MVKFKDIKYRKWTRKYNHLNLPNYNRFNQSAIRTDLNGNNTTIYKNSTYLYRADGVKLKKIHQYFTGRNNGNDVFKTTEYLDGFQYETESIGGRPAPPTPKFFPTAEGYYNFENNKYIYNYTDHLGNVRLSYFKGSNGVEVLEENNYYPFGLKHEGYNPTAGNSSYQYKYNGKELQETGMYDYGARFYMPDIGRWGVVDPLAEKYPSLSPYVYVANNPVNAIDPDGRDIIFVGGNGLQLQYRKGNFYYLNGDLKGQKYDGRNQTVSTTLFSLAKAYRKIEHSNDKVLKGMLHKLETSKNTHVITDNKEKPSQVDIYRKGSEKNYEGDGTLTNFNFNETEKSDFKKSEGVPNSDLSTVAHEMQHQYDYDIENHGDYKYKDGQTARSTLEQRAVKTENRARKIEGLPERTTYGGEKINPNPKNYKTPK